MEDFGENMDVLAEVVAPTPRQKSNRNHRRNAPGRKKKTMIDLPPPEKKPRRAALSRARQPPRATEPHTTQALSAPALPAPAPTAFIADFAGVEYPGGDDDGWK